ncbi:MAG: hypothetical protein KZQ66_19375 [Candidatus Thiodiazotropha sp. (ex Lucinoma aequizonata)]|nr:hypothetical protein [Candidatus Thiodiazotropha sp. (ex Lucinoma aequizonata)]MCU7889086.1 hypothetical protein [Candidatus Thiodiazotropha sp. (ex Lucinoma aequizonata)]MCU7895357.1 hypothetical protein [Candidatus Thiodiazotropha sp. (ex Lucinoma aequizonata)]MCU7897555.1 hypothetical protein [Candidatus Thiodiazotropha sp. (ex Lucinoma aequizonata)]MCU7903870.1 hypothetical protein [Candidatus Thiodiazotropha sp. (ex Lucinoma aequizonata)]
MREHKTKPSGNWLAWSKQRDSLKTRWVILVVAFWVTGIIAVAMYLYNKELNFILTSIAIGMMILGTWLKSRYQIHVRNEPEEKQLENAKD